MLGLGWRSLSLVILSAAIAAVALPQQSVQAQTGNWEYSEAWGGYLDWDTGLVWSEQVGISTWSSANATSALHEAETGFPWRLPTVAECQLAASHGIRAAIPSTGGPCWTSDSRGKKYHYAIDFNRLPNGVDSVYLLYNNSLIYHIHVYRAFTP